MTKNVGKIDKGVRILVGLMLIGFTLMGTIGPWGWVGIIPLVTGLMARCPAYSLLHIDTSHTVEDGTRA